MEKKYFYGQELSNEEIEMGRVSYATLARTFDAVLCNDITKLFYSTVNGDYIEPEMVNGRVDNSEQIEDLREQIEELEREEGTQEQIEDLREQIEELEREEDEPPEIYQYYIIDNAGYRLLTEQTDEIVFYIEELDIAIWGVCHWGTPWSGVYTNIEIDW